MNLWLTLLRDLLVFRRSPADLPYAPMALLVLLLAMILIDYGVARGFTGKTGDPLFAALNNGISLLLVYGLLRAAGKPARFVQTATALLLVQLTVSLTSLLLLAGVMPLPNRPEDIRPWDALRMSLSLPLMLWYLALRAHVLRHALDLIWPHAIGLTLVLTAVEFLISLVLVRVLA